MQRGFAHRLAASLVMAQLVAAGACAPPPNPRESSDGEKVRPVERPDEILRERRLEVTGTDLLIEVIGPDADQLDRAIDPDSPLTTEQAERMIRAIHAAPQCEPNEPIEPLRGGLGALDAPLA